jgi:hypothetical protein
MVVEHAHTKAASREPSSVMPSSISDVTAGAHLQRAAQESSIAACRRQLHRHAGLAFVLRKLQRCNVPRVLRDGRASQRYHTGKSSTSHLVPPLDPGAKLAHAASVVTVLCTVNPVQIFSVEIDATCEQHRCQQNHCKANANQIMGQFMNVMKQIE